MPSVSLYMSKRPRKSAKPGFPAFGRATRLCAKGIPMKNKHGVKLSLGAVLLLPALFPSALQGAAFVGLTDNFQTATKQGWQSGAPNNSTSPFVALNSGPSGAGDNALEITAHDAGGPGSKLVAFNTAQWTGNYSVAGVTGITLDVNNVGATATNLRLALDGAGGRFAYNTTIPVSPGSGWHSVTFSMSPGSFASVGGTDFAATLANVNTLRLMHDDVTPSWQGASINGTILVDNITAVPEPKSTVLIISGICFFWAFARRRLTGTLAG
jgi:hypothetical protein